MSPRVKILHIFIIYICLKQNYIKQYKSFRFLKMWYDERTARLDRFSHNTLKITLGLQSLCSFFRIALFDGEIYTLEPISKGRTDTSLVVISVIKCYLFIF